MKILFIVESPGKINKIAEFLKGLSDNYVIKASKGIFMDLDPKKMSIDFDHNYEPLYIYTKPDVVKDLKGAMKGIDIVYLATDRDREGAGIAQSIIDTLKPKKYKRLLFNEITKQAILHAIKNGGEIEHNLVNSQKARRVLDRLFGYMISPVLQKQIGGKLSAGRVQSVANRIIVDKENEINDFITKNSDSTFFKVNGKFSGIKAELMEATDKKAYLIKDKLKVKTASISLTEGEQPNKHIIIFMKKCLKSNFIVRSVDDKMAMRSPSPPFTTSTLQQEANRKFGMSIDVTMKVAQKLYEGGYITYMRTDSVEISEEGHNNIKKVIETEYGNKYYQKNIYKNKSETSQEAHEAIRPTHPDLLRIEEIDDAYQIKLYRLIWQRTIASQMKSAQIEVTTIQINISKFNDDKIEPYYLLQARLEKIFFQGFMKIYTESTDDPEEDEIMRNFSGKIPNVDDILKMENIIAIQEFLKPPPRYTEASLVKKLEAMGIGRPSTYVNTIKTIIDREYIKIGDIPGIKKNIYIYSIKSENDKHIMKLFEEESEILIGKESKKIIPTKLGKIVNDFLIKNFPEMLDYKFTAKMEEELDDIAEGRKKWTKVIDTFYKKLKPIVENLAVKSNKLLGTDKDDHEIFTTQTKYGQAVSKRVDNKFIYANIPPSLNIETITLNEAIELLKNNEESEFPKNLGKYKDHDVILQKGQYGLYIVFNKQNYSFEQQKDIDLEQAIEIIKKKDESKISEFDIKSIKAKALILNGPHGPYIQIIKGKIKTNHKIPTEYDPTKLTEEMIINIITNKKKYVKPKQVAGIKNTKSGSKIYKKTANKISKKNN
uniref:DNA topoisomerase n=1 Tax=viral metagenome TaxID=1070528 RepID=A0A6C0LTA9_9ZZZZ